MANFREIAERELARTGEAPIDIRAREIRGTRFRPEALELRETNYRTSIGRECFLELVTPEDRIVGFLRLALPEAARTREVTALLPEIGGAAMVRELHVYGAALELGQGAGGEAQHRGLGSRLLEAAAEKTLAAGYSSLAVISAIGTRAYYRRHGFEDAGLYQSRALGGGARER